MLSTYKLLSATVCFALLSFACSKDDKAPGVPTAAAVVTNAPVVDSGDSIAAPAPIERVVAKTETAPAPEVPTVEVPSEVQYESLKASPYYGLGLVERIRVQLGTNVNAEALSAKQDGVFVYGCVQTAANIWMSSGILVEAGRLHGIELTFTGENCTNYDSSYEDSASISLIDLTTALKAESIQVNKDLEAITLTLPNGTTIELTKMDLVLPPLQ
ncbi:MAG: hypothetical protein EOP07_22435 [Proteobacteria bacterium]|nr:MAG: hypothetical protein EOP07_22435 [Pseudomonadota bacterium]